MHSTHLVCMTSQIITYQFNFIQVKIKAYTNQMTSTSMILNNFGTYTQLQKKRTTYMHLL